MQPIALAIFISMLGFTVHAQDFDENTIQTLKNYTSEFPNQTQFSVAILDGAETHFYGLVKFSEGINTLDNRSSIFQIGSVSKVFTSTLLAQLVVEDRIQLTDSVHKYFSIPFQDKGMTLEQLANHTSGLPRLPSNLNLALVNPKNPYQSYTESDLNNYLSSEMHLPSTEERAYIYSNLGAALLAKTLEHVTNTSYAELLSEQIFKPLEMTQSALQIHALDGQLVQGLDQNGNPTPVWEMQIFEGAGGVLSSVEDLSKFVSAHFEENEEAFTLTMMPTFMVNVNLRLGLGWHILQDEEGHDLYWHNGGTGGYSSSVFMVPELQKAVIILTNVSAYHPKASQVDELGFKLLNSF